MGAGAAVTLLALLCARRAAAEPRATADLTRREPADSFLLTGGGCGAATCAEYAAGAAAEAAGAAAAGACTCACPPRAPLYREDRALCVDDISECSLANFGTGPSPQKIPFVFLPLKGQIIHPSKHITFPGVRSPICAVSGAQFLTPRGFVELRSSLDADVPFALFRDEGRTFLQWSGEAELRARMSGRVLLVRLLCRDVSASPSAAPLGAAALDLRGVFTPCVAFRVQGSPAQHIANVSEVQFALNAPTAETSTAGLSVSEYVAIGISSVLLGLIYIASVFLYLHIRKRRKRTRDEENDRKKTLKGLKNKDGTSIRDHDIVRINNERVQSLPSTMDLAEEGLVKNNPLLNMNRQFHDLKNNFVTDSASILTDSDDQLDHIDGHEDNQHLRNQLTSAVVHPCARTRGDSSCREGAAHAAHAHRDRDEGFERLPDEHVSIVETTDARDDRSDIVRPIGSTRRKLYFNPAYFEPHLMAEPPPAAIEFLTKIREVITIAKHKMSAKRFQPVLNEIPEEETYQSVQPSVEFYQGLGSQRSGSVVSLKRENSRKRPGACVGCPGCKAPSSGDPPTDAASFEAPACTNCLNNTRGEKQNSIRKWLDEIPLQSTNAYEMQPNTSQSTGLLNSLLSLPNIDLKNQLRKQNSFSQSLYGGKNNFSFKKMTATSSVRSEPNMRNYNFPLPDFDNLDCVHSHFYSSTSDRTKDTKLTGFRNYSAKRIQPLENQRRNKFITNKNCLPDMISEAIAIDGSKAFNHSSSDEEKSYYGNRKNGPKTSLRTSPDSQGIDYETDSLERNSMNKGISTPTEYTDVPSSQASPSLSAALPLEEELTMRNAVYKTHSMSGNSNTPSPNNEGHNRNNLYETINEARAACEPRPASRLSNEQPNMTQNEDYSLVSEVYVNNYNFGSVPTSPSGSECSMGSRKFSSEIKTESEKPGCLTIVVQDPPENYIKIHESDGFEPDTLDRKHPRHKEILECIQFSRKDLLHNIIDKDDIISSQTIQLTSQGTFKRCNTAPTSDIKHSDNQVNNLRDVYENRKSTFTQPTLTTERFGGSKSLDENVDHTSDGSVEWSTEEGRILTLELRHSKRQRQCTPPSIKQLKSLVRPDVLPPLPPTDADPDTDDAPIYEQPSSPPRRVGGDDLPPKLPTKNVNGRSLSPRTSINNLTADSHLTFQKPSLQYHPHIGPSCSPLGASVQTQFSDYENAKSVRNTFVERRGRAEIDASRNHDGKTFRRKHDGNQPNNCSKPTINSNTFVRRCDVSGIQRTRHERSGSQRKEDSGYLSSDSAGSQRQCARRRAIAVARLASGSDSDDSENEARSESGAESVETHSVFFGSLRKFTVQSKDSSFDSKRSGFRRASSKKTKRMDKHTNRVMC